MIDWQQVYTNMLLTEAKQSKKHQQKKEKSKSETAQKGLSPDRMKELASHDARREVRKSEAKKINKKVSTPSQLNDAEKERLDRVMDNKTVEHKIDKLADKKLREKQLSQEEKDLRRQAASTKDATKKKELNQKAAKIKDQIQRIKDSYAPKKKTKSKDKPKSKPKKKD